MAWNISFRKSAQRDLVALPTDVLAGVLTALQDAKHDPFEVGAEPLRHLRDCYKLRFGSYRVLIRIVASRALIDVFRVGPPVHRLLGSPHFRAIAVALHFVAPFTSSPKPNRAPNHDPKIAAGARVRSSKEE